jgi:putative PIN family toxin of toxin-antitoxin system
MKTWVFDTNVVVSAHLNPHGIPGLLLSEVYARRLRLACDVRMLDEYREVLLRPKFDLPVASVYLFMAIMEDQENVLPRPWPSTLPDPDDAVFLEVAACTDDKVLVSGNLKHFPRKIRGTVRVLSPQEAWSELAAAR